MSQTRRFIRRIKSSEQSFYQAEISNKNESQLRIKVSQSIDREDYQEALNLLNFGTTQSHWIVCTRARVFFKLRKTRRALAGVRDSIFIKRKDCQSCFQLLLKIIQKESQQIETFKQDIDNCLSIKSLSPLLRKQFQRLKLKQIESGQTSEASGHEFDELTSYYADKGMLFKKVEIVEVSSQYRVARAKSTIKAHEVIIFVPESQLITLDLARALPQIDKLVNEQARLQSPKHTILSVFLLLHIAKGLNSPFYNYLQSLPRKLQSFPIYYHNQLLDELQGTYFINILQRKRAEIEEDLQQVLVHVPEYKDLITYDKFIWARMIVSSRIFGIFIEGRKTDALVPIADMLNHKTPKSTTWFFSDEKKGFIVQNNRHQIPKGQQIFDSYGSKCNSRFLLNYGFTIPQNPSNEVMVFLKRPKHIRSSPPSIKLTKSLKSDEFKIVLSYYRQTVLKKTKRDFENEEDFSYKQMNFISQKNECQVWQMIEITMKEQLQAYKTTIKSDQRKLRTNLNQNLKNCIEIRLGQKKILDFYLNMAKNLIECFSGNKRITDCKQYEQYLRQVFNSESSSQ